MRNNHARPTWKQLLKTRAPLQLPAAHDALAAKLRTWREAREKARADLAAAQKQLIEVLTPRQEAMLMNMGLVQ